MNLKEISIIKTVFFNLYYLPLKKAIYAPFRVGRGVKIGNMGKRNSVTVYKIDGQILF